jgi:hypothetical protein
LLSDEEQWDYRKLYPHIAPESVKGLNPQSCASDDYSIPKAIYKKYKFGPLPELVLLAIRSSPAIAKIHEFYCNIIVCKTCRNGLLSFSIIFSCTFIM